VSPAEDEVTSATAFGPTAAGEHAKAAFTTTHWSVVLEAQGESPAAQEALEKLCRTYWRPIYAFLRRQGFRPEEAEDITQGFFAQLLERRKFSALRKEKGRLRSFLLGALKYFLADERRRAMAIKRGKGQRLIPLEDFRADDRLEMEPADPMTAEMIYERRWALTVLERVLSRLKDIRAMTDHGNWRVPSAPNLGALETDLMSKSGVSPFDFAQGKCGRAPLSFLRSGDVLGVIVRGVTVQRWPDAQEKFESVAEIVSIVTIESVGAIVNSKLRADADVEAVAV
jgi:DNA-directed RNA polymerase specialized sigma24 family protein